MKLLSSFKTSINAIATAIIISAAYAYGSHEIAGLNVQHRYPWNGLVDISFDLALDPDEQLRTQIEIVNGEPVISWTPERPATTPEEWYVVEGKANLADKEWAPKADGHRFFRVRIVIPDSL